MAHLAGKPNRWRSFFVVLLICCVVLWLVYCAMRPAYESTYDRSVAEHRDRLFTFEFGDIQDLMTSLIKIEAWLKRADFPDIAYPDI